jgi:hypothetical protein
MYLRQYLGAQRHSVPRLRDVYLGRVPIETALRGAPEELSALAFRLRKRLVARLLREGGEQIRRERRRRR